MNVQCYSVIMKNPSNVRIGSPVYLNDTEDIIGFVHKIKNKNMEVVLFEPMNSDIIKCPFIDIGIAENETWISIFNKTIPSMDNEVLQFWNSIIDEAGAIDLN